MTIRFLPAALLSLGLAFTTVAAAPSTLTIDQAWVRATPPNAAVAGGFLRINNTGAADDALLSADTEAAERVEIHEMKMRGEVMEMRQLTGGLDIPAGKTVELKPGGYHLMLIKPKRPLAEGQSVTLTLRFRKAGERTVSFMVHQQMPMADHDMSQHKH